MSEERAKMRDSMADSCVLSMRCSLWDADETRQNTEAIRAALDRYAQAVAAPLVDQIGALEQERDQYLGYALNPLQAEFPCKACAGRGRRAYGSTATWHGGIGGQAITEDVCDKCWGSGDASSPNPDLRLTVGAWIAAWDAEYRAQVTRAPLVEALRRIVATYESKDGQCGHCIASAALAAYDAQRDADAPGGAK